MIPPALTKEAWASIAAGNGLPYAYGSSVLDDIGMLEGKDIPAAIACLNAALPDDFRGKITWEMVEMCEGMVRDHGDSWRDLADALASYLPTREGKP